MWKEYEWITDFFFSQWLHECLGVKGSKKAEDWVMVWRLVGKEEEVEQENEGRENVVTCESVKSNNNHSFIKHYNI